MFKGKHKEKIVDKRVVTNIIESGTVTAIIEDEVLIAIDDSALFFLGDVVLECSEITPHTLDECIAFLLSVKFLLK